jgi:hypothetical protein
MERQISSSGLGGGGEHIPRSIVKCLRNNFKAARINICGIRNKQQILIDDMIRRKVKILRIADTRVKVTHILKTHMDYIIIFSGVNDNKPAKLV